MTRQRGAEAEQIVCDFLQKKGLKLRDRNFHSRRGEIDLIMQDKDSLIFIEVRARRNAYFGSAAESVTQQKQQRIIAAAQLYLQQHNINQPCRFDVVTVLLKTSETQPLPQVEHWIQDAFQL
jgi:putative endonuclease